MWFRYIPSYAVNQRVSLQICIFYPPSKKLPFKSWCSLGCADMSVLSFGSRWTLHIAKVRKDFEQWKKTQVKIKGIVKGFIWEM